ncbi:bifunctional [glutamine synthetase] adenylyltransferase/[glutamine synthetase]-adenylyl-L-tyrosine phosphorylase [Sediminivirga luteola]|uniref:Glutamate-ammonia-ligase adenylyltransferase n=1 Tax=Sediminivirga luteola TaxID=1774748 RepID=A0A8J2U0B1_9MICO|nr:bifunctional [glutamine synthetase] adenylyltransferase/[glutamine synthetase]-adenylyl-L-tyrosine phosphorylase [Sediminivirga luteola]MCI2263994.1 bifunctional [glutamine synthetase] adenylyltransferase/[glutamine synthetase]-adenylyl-L-tyrosine phosphorylase [Sediminivirga luteola]GGA23143.1 glutamate-ammonia-ligase adenylyltransferase [Sediminivirga luteola]
MARSEPTLGARLRRAGLAEAERAERFLREAGGHLGLDGELADERLVRIIAATADPDAAVLGLVRFAEALAQAGAAGEGEAARFAQAVRHDRIGGRGSSSGSGVFEGPLNLPLLTRLLRVFGASQALTDHAVRHPACWRRLDDDAPRVLLGTPRAAAESLGAELAQAGSPDALRARYRDLVLQLAADDLSEPEPARVVGEVSGVLSHLAGAAIDAALTLARAELPGSERIRFAVIGLGKCGALELNYVSDVDVMYVWEPSRPAGESGTADETGTGELAGIAAALARRTAEICAAPGQEPALWEVDAALRPEGRDGPLVRRLGEYRAYYDAWAQNWEFQALLKARPIAGDPELGEEWANAMRPLVWSAAGRDGFVAEARAMRRRVVRLLPDREAARQVKLGPGGLRDVEFTVQLLQLVHGRADESLRTANTLQSLAALADGGYIGRSAEAALAEAYRFLRVVEHRLQLARLRRTALIPTEPEALRRLARAVLTEEAADRSAEALEQLRAAYSRKVRTLHEQLFYRPILESAARLTTAEARLSEEAARARLEAFGYADPAGAMRHIAALTAGVSRRAAIQKQLLPVLLDWFSEGVDPDAGLLAFRTLSDNLGDSAWYLRMLRDSGAAAQRMTTLLSTSAFVAGLLERRPAAAAWLDDDRALSPKDPQALRAEISGLADRHAGEPGRPGDAVTRIRAAYSREVLRSAIREVLQLADVEEIAAELTCAMDLTIDGVVKTLRRQLEGVHQAPEFRFAVIAMGRLGGQEVGFHSDADVMFVMDVPAEAGDEHRQAAAAAARELALAVRSRLGEASGELGIDVDADLRPEGKQGPLVRTLASYARYYESWSEPWEAQALLRARPIAGDEDLGREYLALIDPLRYPERMPAASVRQVRRLKARMEAERLPRGADATRHCKLGRGGLADVEWTVQLLQLRHAHAHPKLRTTGTLEALRAAVDLGLMDADDADVLRAAWRMASRVRSAAVLWRGRTAHSLPTHGIDLEAVARICGYPPEAGRDFEQDYLRTTRHARKVMERLFYEG